MRYDYLIVGSGLFGATFAHQARKAGRSCLVIDKRPWLGGNVYCSPFLVPSPKGQEDITIKLHEPRRAFHPRHRAQALRDVRPEGLRLSEDRHQRGVFHGIRTWHGALLSCERRAQQPSCRGIPQTSGTGRKCDLRRPPRPIPLLRHGAGDRASADSSALSLRSQS